jgi:putative ABC transport system permease protein
VLAAAGWVFGRPSELAARNLARQRRRSTTTSLMFALSVSFVLFLASLAALFNRVSSTFIEHRLGADLRITAGGRDEGAAAAVAKVPGVRAVSEVAFLHGRSEEGVAFDVVAGDVVGMRQLWVVPFGVDSALEGTFFARHARFAEGDASAFTALHEKAEEPAAIVCLAMARHLGVSKGDLIELAFHLGRERVRGRFRIAAVAETMPGFHNFRAREGNAHGAGLMVSSAAFREMTDGAPDEAFGRFLLVKGPEDAASKIREDLGLRYQLGVECAAEERRETEVLYWATQVLFALLLCLAVTIAVFGLVASTTSGVAERRREVAVLKAVGLRRGHLFRMFAAEAVVLTVSAGALGAAIGYLVAYLFVAQAAMLMELPVVFTVPVVTLVATLGVSVVAGFIAAFIATRGLLHRPVAEILRG